METLGAQFKGMPSILAGKAWRQQETAFCSHCIIRKWGQIVEPTSS